MNSLILKTTARWIVPVLLLYSVYLLFRGHNLPGGGFEGGLIAAVGLLLHAITFSAERTKKVFGINPVNWIGTGLLLALASGLWGLFADGIIFKGYWTHPQSPFVPELGTPFLFDLGVYLVVIGSTLLITFRVLK